MRGTSLEGRRWRFAILGDPQLPALLDGAHALVRVPTHALQYHKGEQDEAYMAHHRLIHPTLARLQPRVLLGVAEDRLDGPAAHLALDHARKVRPRFVGDDVLVVAVAVSGRPTTRYRRWVRRRSRLRRAPRVAFAT